MSDAERSEGYSRLTMRKPTPRAESGHGLNAPHALREPWLMAGKEALRPHIESAGYPLPQKIRCCFSLMSSGTKGNRKGECWSATASADGHHEIFICPDQDQPVDVLAILVHELIHACLPDDAGHGPVFKKAATAVGLIGPMRSTVPGPLLAKHLEQIAEALGPLPHARLDLSSRILDRPQPASDSSTPTPQPADRPKKQDTRMLKAKCTGNEADSSCGYTVRLTRKWAETLGAACPRHGMMAVEIPRAAAAPEATPDASPDEPEEGV